MSAHVAGVMEGRVFVRCDNCHLPQFPSITGACRKCHSILADPDDPIEETAPEPEPELRMIQPIDIAFACKTLRHWRNWSQRDMAQHGGYVRTYISKVENRTILPTVSGIEKLSAAFGVSPQDFMALATIGQENA